MKVKYNTKRIAKMEALIAKKKQQIEALEDEIIDCMDAANLANGYWEQTATIGKGKEAVKRLVGYKQWIENFIDEDTGNIIPIERNVICRIDGFPADRWGRIIRKHNNHETTQP
jgi:hypothetical protein